MAETLDLGSGDLKTLFGIKKQNSESYFETNKPSVPRLSIEIEIAGMANSQHAPEKADTADSQQVNFFKFHSSETINQLVKQQCKEMFHDTLLQSFSWYGSHGKKTRPIIYMAKHGISAS